MLKSIDKVFLKSLENCGNPIQALLSQNLEYKCKYNNIVFKYLQTIIDVKKAKVWIDNRLD